MGAIFICSSTFSDVIIEYILSNLFEVKSVSLTTQEFVNKYDGKEVAWGECVALFWQFNKDVNKSETYSAVGAINLWEVDGEDMIWDTYDRVDTGYYGDWAIWSGSSGPYQNGGYGHVAMFISNNGNNTGQFFSQNPGNAGIITLSYEGIVGFLHMKDSDTQGSFMVNIDESLTSPNFTPAELCSRAFGYPRIIIGYTIHHWDAKNSGASYEGTVRTLTTLGGRGVSAHFVVEAGRVSCLVNPLDAAWHAGNPQGNAQTIGLELQPLERDGDYQTAAELIGWLWSRYNGPKPLYHHYDWTSTSCPGDYDLNRLYDMSMNEYNKIIGGTVVSPGIPPVDTSTDWFDNMDSYQQKAVIDAAERVNGVIPNAQVLTVSDLDAIAEHVVAKLKGSNVTLVKGDKEDTVYVWDASNGYRGIAFAEFASLVAQGASLTIIAQDTLNRALGK